MLCLTPLMIKVSRHFASPIKEELGEGQQAKKGIGHFGGVTFVFCFLVGIAFTPININTKIVIIAVLLFALIGFIDDCLKSRRKSSDGLKSITKFVLQVIASLIIVYLLTRYNFIVAKWYYIAFYVAYITFFVNAINITDGLDGMASLISIILLSLLYLLNKNATSIIFIYCLMGFLYFNGGKAKIFMGDTGSHAIGAIIAVEAILSAHPLYLIFASLIPTFELFSSLIQIIAIRGFDKKVFLIAPYHHHLEKKGVEEQVIVVRFSLITLLLSTIAYFIIY